MHTERGFTIDDRAIDLLLDILKASSAQISNYFLFNAVVAVLPRNNLKIYNLVLNNPLFYALHEQIVCRSLNKAGAAVAKKAAETILEQDMFFSTMPDDIVITALNKAGAEAAKIAVETILSQDKFFSKLPPKIVGTALNKASVEAAKKAAETILLQNDFFNTLPGSIVSTALNKARAEAAKKAAETILSQNKFFSTLSFEIVSTALNKAGAKAAEKAADTILSQNKFFSTLPDSIVSTALNKAVTGVAKTAAETILSQNEFFSTLPFPIVSTALQILGSDDAALQAARMILSNTMQVNTFLLFQAIKTLLQSGEETDRILIHEVVDNINNNLRSHSKGFNLLYYNLLYLPLFDMPTHQDKVRRVFSEYRPTAQILVKYNVYKVLNCHYECHIGSYFYAEVKELSERILLYSVADIECQRKKHPLELSLGHIRYALRHPELVAEVAQAKKHLLDYGQQYPDFQQTVLYKEAAGMVVDSDRDELR